MNKLLLLVTLTPLLLASQTDLEKRVLSLEKELISIKKNDIDNRNEILELIPIVEDVEKKSILDKINLSPELEIRLDKFDYKLGDIDGETTKIYDGDVEIADRRRNYTKHFNPASSIKFQINMSSQLDDKVSFYGRMSFMNNSQAYQRVCILSRDIKSTQSSSAFDVDLAYFNLTNNKNSDYAFTLTFGVLPTSGGTPMQFANNGKRKSMFPALVFDMNTYGAIGTQKLGKNNFLRVIFAKAYTKSSTFYPYQCNRENIDNASIAGLYYDSKFNFLGKSLLSLGLNLIHDFKAHPYLGPDVSSSDSQVLGDIMTYGIGLDIEEVAQSKFTIFAHTALSIPNGNGNSDNYQIVAEGDQNLSDGLTSKGTTGFSVADYAQGEMLSNNGYSYYIGIKYDYSSSLIYGAEYNYGSKYWFSATQGADDMYNKLATRGQVGEAYAIWKLHKNIYTKIGFMLTKEHYTGSGWHFGEPAKKDGTQRVSYLSLKAKF